MTVYYLFMYLVSQLVSQLVSWLVLFGKGKGGVMMDDILCSEKVSTL